MDPDGLQVVVSDASGRPVRVRGLSPWLRRVAPSRARGRVGIALVSDRRIRALNRTYRGHDRATDVLSFAASGGLPARTSSGAFVSSGADNALGDIVIARGVAKRQARRARHSELTELRILALHGLLHLLGYDHERDEGRMGRVERRLRRKGGLTEGLIERSGDRARRRSWRRER